MFMFNFFVLFRVSVSVPTLRTVPFISPLFGEQDNLGHQSDCLENNGEWVGGGVWLRAPSPASLAFGLMVSSPRVPQKKPKWDKPTLHRLSFSFSCLSCFIYFICAVSVVQIFVERGASHACRPHMDEDEWTGLEILGQKLLDTVIKFYGCASSFANSFDTEDEAQEVFKQLADSAGLDIQRLTGEAARRLVEWSVLQQTAFKRRRRTVVAGLEYSLFPIRTDAPVETSDVFESIVKDDPKYALEVAKRVAQQRKSSTVNRADLEEALRDKYAMELATFISEAGLPVVYQIHQLDNPNKAWKRIFGSRRGKTLRNRFRSWSKFRLWLVAYSGAVWLRSLADLVNYVEECIQVGCALSIHTELQASLVLLERSGRVLECNQLSMDPTWKAHLQSWSQELSSNSRPNGSGPPYTVSILLALEFLVMDDQRDYYARVIA